jgi:transposase InsO family protein
MKVHASARLSPIGRRLLVDRIVSGKFSVREAAEAQGVSDRTAYRWLARWRAEGEAGLLDRSSAPHRIPHKTPLEREQLIAKLRRLWMTAAEIAEVLGMAISTVCAVLKRIGLGKRSRLEPPEPPNRYELSAPGELVHIDIKKLGAIKHAGKRMLGRGPGRYHHGAGWQFVHIAIDDHSRLAYVEVLADERASTAVGFLSRAVAWFADHGVQVQRVMTDNGSCYRSHRHRIACLALGVRHTRTRPGRPRTNGKAERFIQTLLREWAYSRLYASERERLAALPTWLDRYNWHRPHGSLSHKPPGSRLTNLAGNYN